MKKLYSFYLVGIVSIHFYSALSNPLAEDNSNVDIPDGFLLGAGTSAFQVEGAWNTSGKSESFIEYIMRIINNTSVNAHVTSDSYHKYKEDVKVLKYIGLHVYRFSMSWSRLLPTGYINEVNKDGVRYYHALLDELEENGIEPLVFLHHFDHPVVLEKFGGWKNESMIEIYLDYARFVFKEFGSRVKIFITFNEPNEFCFRIDSKNLFYSDDYVSTNLTAAYLCGHNMLKAHAKVYHMYDEEFRAEQNGIIGVNLNCANYFPKYENDSMAVEVAYQFECGWFSHPLFSKMGDYPEIMKEMVREHSFQEGLEQSRLPTFSQEWIDYIKGSADYFGLSHYLSHIVETGSKGNETAWINNHIPTDAELILSKDPNWPTGSNGYQVVPYGLRILLNKIKEEYDNPTVYVIENGYSDTGYIDDQDRVKFLYSFIRQILNAINYDNCNVKSYIYWSLIDGYEFGNGFDDRFGLAHVDFNHPNRTRTLKTSATWLRNVIKTKKLYIDQ